MGHPVPGIVICNFPSFSLYRKKFGQLQYLENLRKSDYSKKGGQNPELCPICRNALGSAWSVMQVSLIKIIVGIQESSNQ